MARRNVTITVRGDELDAREALRNAHYRLTNTHQHTRARLYLASLVDQGYRDLGIPPPD